VSPPLPSPASLPSSSPLAVFSVIVPMSISFSSVGSPSSLPPSSLSRRLLAAVVVVLSHPSFAAVVVDLILPSCHRGRPPPALQAGILRYKNWVVIGSSTDLRNKIFASFHASIFGGHSGQRVTLHKIKQIFYWPNLKKDIVEKVAQCPVCQLSKTEHVQYPGLLNLLQIPLAKMVRY
jgi:hypothetical protein